MRFQVLGGVRAIGPAGVVPLDGAPRLLLAVLLADVGRTVAADELAAALWPASPPDEPVRALAAEAVGVRRALGAAGGGVDGHGVLHVGPDGGRLAVPASSVDVGRFEALLVEAEAAHAGGDDGAARERGRQARRLWAGDPYEGLAEHDALRAEVDRLRALRRRLDDLLAQVDPTGA